ncbi:helix-turn-helix domain-containing protein [Hymenobacter guriensis]|uniref:Helix-turn-helix transcriptional regulator n=1 Tax=Hymenobacter guriensis TaxID=2793065 RepID=A0ABS0KZ32_9BACT|nr:helix-turn-helix transcriptional regulator [Hymenobacter guriensis]MBG8553068.1 helix-turn-helix transcriptional regulator [Hymenobacter guriensis]
MAHKKINVIVEKTGTGYSAYASDEAVYAGGATFAELKKNMVGACNFAFEDTSGRVVTEDDLQFTLDVPQFFEFYKELNVSKLAARIDMSQPLLAAYINGSRKPSEKQITRILAGVRSLGRELADIDLI